MWDTVGSTGAAPVSNVYGIVGSTGTAPGSNVCGTLWVVLVRPQ